MLHLALLFIASAAAQPGGTGQRVLAVTDFERVQVDGPFVVNIRTGLPSSARIRADRSGLDQVSVDTQGGVLRIRRVTQSSGAQRARSGPITIELATRNLRQVRLNGAGRVSVDRIRGGDVELTLIGDGSLSVPQITADRLVLGLAGGGQLQVGGRVEELRGQLQGTGSLDGANLQTEQADLTTATAGTVRLRVTEAARVTASGIGDVEISGTTDCTTRGPSAGQVVCSNQRQAR